MLLALFLLQVTIRSRPGTCSAKVSLSGHVHGQIEGSLAGSQMLTPSSPQSNKAGLPCQHLRLLPIFPHALTVTMEKVHIYLVAQLHPLPFPLFSRQIHSECPFWPYSVTLYPLPDAPWGTCPARMYLASKPYVLSPSDLSCHCDLKHPESLSSRS